MQYKCNRLLIQRRICGNTVSDLSFILLFRFLKYILSPLLRLQFCLFFAVWAFLQSHLLIGPALQATNDLAQLSLEKEHYVLSQGDLLATEPSDSAFVIKQVIRQVIQVGDSLQCCWRAFNRSN